MVYHDENIFICENLSLLPRENSPLHADVVAMLFCAAGRAQVRVTDTVHTIKAGDVFVCSNLDILTDCLFSQDFRYAVVGMNAKYANSLMEGEPDFIEQYLYIKDHPVLYIGEETKNVLLPTYALMFDTKIRQHRHPYHRQSIDALMKMTMFEILGYFEEQRRQDDTFVPYQKAGTQGGMTIFKRFLLLLAEDNCQHRSVSYFADELCITPKYLCAVCKRESKRTPLEWIHSTMAQRIRHLLLHSDMSVKEIATSLNFPNLSFFGKFVRQHLGMSPSIFRTTRGTDH